MEKKLDIEQIKKNLNTSFVGKKIIYYDILDSTQDEAKRLVKNEEHMTNGTYIVTDNQTNGRGTKSRAWYSSSYKNICGTIVLTPNCNINKIDKLTIIIAECVIEAIKKLYNIEVNIKYPNDIIYKGKKICGILTESITNKELVKYIFIGIGIDVNETEFCLEIRDIATSLKMIIGKDLEREIIITEFFNLFEKKYIELLNK